MVRHLDEELYHYGVKGMKWGVRRNLVREKAKSYRTSRKTDPKTDFLKINRPNSAARSYYRAQRTPSFRTYRKQTAIADKKMSGLSKDQIENGRYRVARARNIKRKTVSSLLGVGIIGAAAASPMGTAGLAAIPVGALVGVGANYVTGGHYYQGQSATYGSRRARREING